MLDLTDDPQGVFKGQGSNRSAMFRDVAFNVRKNGIERRFRMQFFLNDQDALSYLSILSSYKGEIELQGKKWLLEIQDNLDGVLDQKDRLLLQPVDHQANEAASSGFMPVPSRLFLEGHLYKVDFKYEAGSGPAPLLAGFTEMSSPMAEMALDGESIQLLDSPKRLRNRAAGFTAATCFAARRQISGPFHFRPIVPTDIQTCECKPHPGSLHCCRRSLAFEGRGALDQQRDGSSLRQHAEPELCSKRGRRRKSMRLPTRTRSQPPKWAVYKGDRLLASGSFEFG